MIRKLIERPIAVSMSLIALLVLGIVAINLIPVSLVPNIDIPQVTVQVSAIDMSTRELDEVVVKPLRNSLMQMNNMSSLTTETKDGVGNIYMSFDYGSDIDYTFIEVNEKIDKSMNSLPRDIDRPKAIKASATDIPAFYLNVSLRGDDNFTKSDLYPVSPKFAELTSFVRQVLVKRIEQLEDVAMVDVSGIVDNEILVVPDASKLKSLDISYDELEAALHQRSLNLGNLSIRDGEYHYSVRFESKIISKLDIEQTYININNRVFQIGDLAEVYEHPQKRKGLVLSDGENAVTMAIIKQSDAQMAGFKDKLEELVTVFEKEYPDIKFVVTRDQTQLLDYSIDNLIDNIIVGGVLACLVLFLFMKDLRTPFLITLSIPMAVIVSLLFFFMFNITINIISLSGFVLGIGMMVDNSIVVIDNITQRWLRGDKLKDAVALGTSEVFMALLSSVLTTCSVFLPLIFLSDISGALFYDQAMSIAISLFSSLAVAMTVIPVYYYLMYRKSDHYHTNHVFSKMKFDYHRSYEKLLKWFMRNQWSVWVSVVISIFCSFLLFANLQKENLPKITEIDMLLEVDWNERVTIDENERRVRQLYDMIKPTSTQVTAIIGSNQFMLSHTKSANAEEFISYIKCGTADSLSMVKNDIKTFMEANYPEAIVSFNSSGNIFDLIFSSKEAPLVARLRPTNGKAPEPLDLNLLLDKISKQLPGHTIEPVACTEQVRYVARPEIMALYKVSYLDIIGSLKNALGANKLFTIVQGQSSVPIIIGDNKNQLYGLIENTYIEVNGESIAVSTFLMETKAQDLKNLISGSEGDYYPLSLYIEDDQVEHAMTTIKQVVAEDKNYEVDYSGSYFSSRKMLGELTVVLIVSLLLLYFILAAQFESLIQPVIVMSEIVIDIAGAFFVLWIAGATLNLMSMIGLIVMGGIVINDSILKVDTINKLRKDGYSLVRAIMVAGYRRLTPIIMTSLTTILAVSPFLSTGDLGSDLQFPLSLALIGGMIIGTIVSVFFVPVIYYEIYKRSSKNNKPHSVLK